MAVYALLLSPDGSLIKAHNLENYTEEFGNNNYSGRLFKVFLSLPSKIFMS